MYRIPQLKIFCHGNLNCANSAEDEYHISDPTFRKSFASILPSSYFFCWINIPSCSSRELQLVTSHRSVTLLNTTRCLHAGARKWFQGQTWNFDQRSSDYGVFHSAAVNCPGCPSETAEIQRRIFRSEHISFRSNNFSDQFHSGLLPRYVLLEMHQIWPDSVSYQIFQDVLQWIDSAHDQSCHEIQNVRIVLSIFSGTFATIHPNGLAKRSNKEIPV
jgi:hypothetical protein